MRLCGLLPPWIYLFACMGGCFGCCAKPPTIIAIGASSKGRRVQKRSVKKSSKSNNFWSTSAGDMENSTMLSQGSLSSISTLNQQLDPSSAGSTSNSSEFVNRGVLLWNQTRQQWLGNKKTQNRKQVREPTISWNATYESLLGSNKPFARPVPLAEMVDFLVDVWEQEGLYDWISPEISMNTFLFVLIFIQFLGANRFIGACLFLFFQPLGLADKKL